MLSALIRTEHSYPALPLGTTTGAPEVRPSRSSRTRDGVLFNCSTPMQIGDRTVSRRSEPSSRTALIGEQPNPWDLLQPQDAMSRHRGAKPAVAMDAWARSACYPRSSFYPLSFRRPMSYGRITSFCFRICSTCKSCS
jgi:hypothetical protein